MIIAPLGKLPFQTYPLFAEVGELPRLVWRVFGDVRTAKQTNINRY